MTINIYLNKQETQIDEEQSLADILIQHNYKGIHCAIALNDQLVSRINHDKTILQAGDEVDIIVPMQGG